jgi:hypothetical protein
VTAADGARNVVMLTVVRKSPDRHAKLSSLELLPAATLQLRPAFRWDRFVFDATVPTDRATVRVRLNRVHVNATVTVAGAHTRPTHPSHLLWSFTLSALSAARRSLSLSLSLFLAVLRFPHLLTTRYDARDLGRSGDGSLFCAAAVAINDHLHRRGNQSVR